MFNLLGTTPKGGMAGVAMTPGGTPFRDQLNINTEDQLFDDEKMSARRQQVRRWDVFLVLCIFFHVCCYCIMLRT